MEEQINQFNKLVDSSRRIFITSHISPDADAVCSVLLMGETLIYNFSDKRIHMVLEEEPLSLDFLSSYEKLEFRSLHQAISEYKPDLLILLDGNNMDRASRKQGDAVREYLNKNNVKTAIIDHHELTGKDKSHVFINNHDPAAAQTVYELLFNKLNYKRPKSAAKTAMTGYYADTGGFVYLKDGNNKIFSFVEELISQGADIEETKNALTQFKEVDMNVLSELCANTSHKADYTFSYLGDVFMDEWLKSHSQAELQRGTGAFLDSYIRNIDKRPWGYIVYKNVLQGDNFYTVSFRALSGAKDVSILANSLGGGGHKPAAAAKFESKSIEDALAKVEQVINSNT